MKQYNTIVSVAGLLMLLLSMPHGFAGDRGVEEYPVTINGVPMVRSVADSVLGYIIGNSVGKQITITDNNAGKSIILSFDGRMGTATTEKIVKAGMDITASNSEMKRIVRLYRCSIGMEQDCSLLLERSVLDEGVKCLSDEEQGRGKIIHMCIDTRDDNRITRCFVY